VDNFRIKNKTYCCDDLPLAHLAQSVGTPSYIYSESTLRQNCQQIISAFESYPTLACFAVKALSNLSVLHTIFAEGLGADLVSGGELRRALLAGVRSDRIVFSGVGKQADEIRQALHAGILMFNVESPFELELIAALAREAGRQAAISFRVNPNIDAQTNEKIATGLYSTKFGLPEGELAPLLDQVRRDPHLELAGLACHIGSQIIDLQPMREAVSRMVQLVASVQGAGHKLRYLNMGGGLGIRYRDEEPPSLKEYGRTLIDAVRPTGLHLIIEPGRALVGNIGILLTRVVGVKKTPERHFIVLDAAMNDLLRPTLYGSYHEIEPVTPHQSGAPSVTCDFVGPICETGDFLGKGRTLPLPKVGDLYLIRGCGAYASSMAFQYNSRPRAPEILVKGDQFQVIRARENPEELWAGELSGLAARSPAK